ncbi:MAG: hypothetical protein RB191_22005 [Terriglobia bacterium]|nr:hypothetical protein [Terriglobia bacterium]
MSEKDHYKYGAERSTVDQFRAELRRANQRVAELESLLLEAREWIETDADALEECHKPYDLDNPIDVEIAQEVDDRRTWLTRTAPETPVSTLCAVCDQIKELHPSSHPWTAKETPDVKA